MNENYDGIRVGQVWEDRDTRQKPRRRVKLTKVVKKDTELAFEAMPCQGPRTIVPRMTTVLKARVLRKRWNLVTEAL